MVWNEKLTSQDRMRWAVRPPTTAVRSPERAVLYALSLAFAYGSDVGLFVMWLLDNDSRIMSARAAAAINASIRFVFAMTQFGMRCSRSVWFACNSVRPVGC